MIEPLKRRLDFNKILFQMNFVSKILTNPKLSVFPQIWSVALNERKQEWSKQIL